MRSQFNHIVMANLSIPKVTELIIVILKCGNLA